MGDVMGSGSGLELKRGRWREDLSGRRGFTELHSGGAGKGSVFTVRRRVGALALGCVTAPWVLSGADPDSAF